MKTLFYILLGLLQGFTEPLPISSSGHLTLFKHIFNTGILNDANFLIVSNFGSFIAILIIFWKDIVDLVKSYDEKYQELVEALKDMTQYIFTKENLLLSFTGNNEGYKVFKIEFSRTFIRKFIIFIIYLQFLCICSLFRYKIC